MKEGKTPMLERYTTFSVVLVLSLGLIRSAAGEQLTLEEETFFETKVRPVLAGTCIECHGPEVASGGLRLDSRDAILQGGDSGPAVIPGDADESLLVRAIRHDEQEALQMPPDDPLPSEAVEDLQQWIAAGAKWPAKVNAPLVSDRTHWAFAPLSRPAPPEDPTGWSAGAIDRFIAARRHEQGLEPVEPADKRTLVRRAYYDLIGLPPTPRQVDVFLEDDRPEAFAELVEQLLASPHYGERWGRHWLDLVRYADTAGDDSDYPIPQARLYRDYVIDAFNADMPYDRFLHEQLAGDLLAKDASGPEFERLLIATGFIAQAKRIGTHELEGMHLIIEDTLSTLGHAVLGLSLRCARCHDHKYDPISQRDYYGLYGFFASTQYPFPGGEELRRQTHFAPLLAADEAQQRRAAYEEQLAELRRDIERQEKDSELARQVAELDEAVAVAEREAAEAASESESESDEQTQCATRLEELQSERDSAARRLERRLKTLRDRLAEKEKEGPFPDVTTVYGVQELEPVDVAIHREGNPRRAGDVAPRGVPRVLAAEPLEIPEGTSGRLELARWITEQADFLAARVMANRIWQNHFGKPIVATPSDFGFRGTPPTHPELLDWLAAEFIASGWSIKSLHRQIMLSNTYQLASTRDELLAERDGANRWYWRFDRRRMDAEALRDTVLTLGGTLDLSRPGPHPFPEKSKWRFTAHHQFNQISYPSDHRSVYLMVQRLHAHPYLSLFDGPDTSLSTAQRDSSIVPLQALFLLNNEMIHREAERFARRLIAEQAEPADRLRAAFLLALARPPEHDEATRALAFLQQYEDVLRQEGVEPDHWELEAWSGLARTLLASNELIFID